MLAYKKCTQQNEPSNAFNTCQPIQSTPIHFLNALDMDAFLRMDPTPWFLGSVFFASNPIWTHTLEKRSKTSKLLSSLYRLLLKNKTMTNQPDTLPKKKS